MKTRVLFTLLILIYWRFHAPGCCTVLANQKINVVNINSSTDQIDQLVHTNLTIEIHAVEELVTIMDKLAQLPNVQDVRRVG